MAINYNASSMKKMYSRLMVRDIEEDRKERCMWYLQDNYTLNELREMSVLVDKLLITEPDELNTHLKFVRNTLKVKLPK